MSQSTTKKDIANAIARDLGITQAQSKQFVQKTLDAITNVLRDKGRLELRDFGVFECKTRKARKGRNPKTGDPVNVPEKLVVTFRAGKQMERTVRRNK
ncbi:MAG: HU family DNA-binding protein [Planctomycetaceae bacterium]|jgi:nucleoid DNA-binding protein|nr:HU family DNA-binding protein [Planctomycetaceae bacterium]MBT4012545.1 HU family DNA-binding protein [Planctomycetaceae bacterium]MBT4724278.1 HU family DNA-binding protein [Planctomycetaceae bacterium]MBT4847044.1 HU family DNA-binding protein [Planctomycetaceae bacterium]MBT5125983.1 HU family DNA-binding protein [Planctomycetaceae bacterium]